MCPISETGIQGSNSSEDQWHIEEVLTWKAMEFAIAKMIRRGNVAL